MNLKNLLNQAITKDVGKNNGATRERWLEKTLLSLKEGTSILDAGAGESKYKSLCNHLDYFSQDIAEYDGEGDGKGIQTNKRDYSNLDFVSDICNMPIEDESFDAVMCIEVIEHVPNPVEALGEIHRVLKKGGNLILTAPFNSLTHYAPYHYSTGFSSYFYEHHLNNLGFEIIEIDANGNFFEFLGQETRRLKTVSSKYSNYKLNFFNKVTVYMILNLLNKLSMKNKGSEELLCFGYQVLCKKI